MTDPPFTSESEIKLSKMLATKRCLNVKMTYGSERVQNSKLHEGDVFPEHNTEK